MDNEPRVGDLIRLTAYTGKTLTGLILDITDDGNVIIWWMEINRVDYGDHNSLFWFRRLDCKLLARAE